MKKLLTVLLASLFATTVYAQAAGGSCEAQATEKKLAGAAKNSFMKKCEREAKAAEGKTAKTAQQEKMKTCNKEAGEKKLAGKERKAFMSDCLKAK
ncbi:MAG: hypothetical protein JNK22_07570 [Rhodocyclaceae bacterium]|nr:hypothetical protein [Rhodocyclaceae bacterium]